MKDIWKKLMANIGINAMSALCNFRVGEIFDVPETKETILREAYASDLRIPELAVSQLGENACAIGAAASVLENILS
jgi:hypothetical protein